MTTENDQTRKEKPSYGKLFLLSASATMVILAVVFLVICLCCPTFQPDKAWVAVPVIVGSAVVVGGAITGAVYGAVFLTVRGRFLRKFDIGCGFERACQLCLTSLKLLPNSRLLECAPGRYFFSVTTNPLLKKLRRDRVPFPEEWWWIEEIRITLEPVGRQFTMVLIESRCDLNSSLHYLFDKTKFNVDILAEFLKKEAPAGTSVEKNVLS